MRETSISEMLNEAIILAWGIINTLRAGLRYIRTSILA